MAVNDIQLVSSPVFGPAGSLPTYAVAANATAINVGEPVMITLGATSVAVMTTNKPVVSTDYLVGIATSAGSQTATAAGKVSVMPLLPGQVFSILPKVAATFNTQDKYDALVNARVLLDLTSGSYTILAADGSTNGCVIVEKDITVNPSKVHFIFRNGVSYLS